VSSLVAVRASAGARDAAIEPQKKRIPMDTSRSISNPIEKLASLAAGRTERTDRLVAAVHSLLSRLDSCVEVGTRVVVDGRSLVRVRIRSNVGSETYWSFVGADGDESDTGAACLLDASINEDGYLHGDFHARVRGPSRVRLVEFAIRADQFVAALIARQERENEDCDAATGTVATAAKSL
jgi:hypothetical protein